ncbi:MAG: MBL fold metallo-hydrolase [Phycisphaerales bacterium]
MNIHASRREFLHLAALAGGSLALAGVPGRVFARTRAVSVLAEPSMYTAMPLPDGGMAGLRIAALMGDGGNSLVAGDGKGGWSLLIDTKNAPLGSMLRASGAAMGGADFSKGERLVINTHHHGDHTGGNWAFTQGEGGAVPILAHANAQPRVLAQTKQYLGSVARVVKDLQGSDKPEGTAALPFAREYMAKAESFKPEAWAPTKTISGEKNEISVGALKVEAYHFGPGHTDNDLVLRLPDQNTLHMGDLLFHNNWPFIDRSALADTMAWMKVLGEAVKLCDAKTVVIPGHGDLTDVEGLKAMIVFFERVRAVVGEAITAGKKREDVVKMEPAEFAARGLKQIRERTLGGVYDELTGVAYAAPK